MPGVGIVFRLHEQSGKLLVHSLNEGGSAMVSGKIKEGDMLLQVSKVDVTNCRRPGSAPPPPLPPSLPSAAPFPEFGLGHSWTLVS